MCFRYTLDGEEYLDDMGLSMPSEELFRRMSNGAETKTSQVSVEEYITHFERMLTQGLDVLHVTLTHEEFYRCQKAGRAMSTSQPAPSDVMALWDRALEEYDELVYIPMSSGLSASCHAAIGLSEDYGGRVQVVDNHRISVTQRSAVLDAMALARAGCSAVEIKAELERTALDSMIYIGVDTLEYLKRGGRITPAAAMGSILHLKPLLKIEGERLDAYATVRGREACKRRLLDAMKRSVEEFHRRGWSICIGAAGSFLTREEGEAWLALAAETFPGEEVCYDPLALSISCHTGPGAFGMAVSRRVRQ